MESSFTRARMSRHLNHEAFSPYCSPGSSWAGLQTSGRRATGPECHPNWTFVWSQFVGQLFIRKQFINCEDIRCHLVEFDV